MRKWFQVGTLDEPRYYRGLKDMAVDGLHKDVATLVKGPDVLDLGSGEGALSQRLRDAGMYVEECNDIDFDSPGWSKEFGEEKYGSVIAIEVIEHLKAPRLFFEEAVRLVKPGGQLLISSPNIENPISKAIFLLRGKYFLFDKDALAYGHISPITQFQIQTMCSANHVLLESVFLAGTYPIIYLHRNLKDTVLWSAVALAALPFSDNQSPCKVYDIVIPP